MDESTARYLTGPEGAGLLEAAARGIAASGGDAAPCLLALRKQGVPPEQAAGAVQVVEARRRAARQRYPDAERLFLTPESLAQATSPALADYHGRLLAPFGAVADLCCGVGMDALALAAAGAAHVLAVDIDPARLAFAEANARIRGVSERIRFLKANVTDIASWREGAGGPPIRAAFLDPARRTAERRVSRAGDQYSPPLSFVPELLRHVEALGVKLSPALPDADLAALGGSVTFLSEGRECKEAFVWAAPGDAPGPAPFSALLLPEGVEVSAAGDGTPAPVGPLGAFLLDPDPAIIRAGALADLCDRAGAVLLSPEDAYLTADTPPPGAHGARLASAYRVLHAEPYSPRRLGRTLRDRGIGRLVVKKRRFPQEPAALARELKLSGHGTEVTLVLVQEAAHRFLAVLCEPAAPAP